jgi:Flp pilus assembly protein TadD
MVPRSIVVWLAPRARRRWRARSSPPRVLAVARSGLCAGRYISVRRSPGPSVRLKLASMRRTRSSTTNWSVAAVVRQAAYAVAMPDARIVQREAFGHFAAGRVDEAVAGYRRALALDPELAIAWNGLAMALERAGDLDGAIEAARRLIELEPDEALGHTSLSRFYQQKGMIPEAEDEAAIATKLAMRKKD